ncbi:thiol:disulfide interchange protein DsbA/DsbL [Paraburkholderia youngii]|uniref:thiol:disulfide interchange protein DsbA/DsbL n=1 Tax=Paraburkholderia youngii TaxID=2782701 RepID=UPI003D23B490
MKFLGKFTLVKLAVASVVGAGLAAAFIVHAMTGTETYPQTASGYGVIANAVPPATTSPVEVIDYFFYDCPHCNDFNRPLEAWVAHEGGRIRVRRVPVGNAPVLMRHQRLYYALDQLGQAERLHDTIYSAIHQQGQSLETDDQIVQWVSAHGVDAAAFKRAYASNEVTAKVAAGQAELARANIGTVPSVVIGGEWVVSPTTAGGLTQAVNVMSGRVDATIAGEKPTAVAKAE